MSSPPHPGRGRSPEPGETPAPGGAREAGEPPESAAPSALPAQLEETLRAYDRFLSAERGRSVHTRRAYLSDVRDLLSFALSRGLGEPADLDLALLRGWLAAMTADGRARSTIARRAASARSFTAWAARTGRAGQDAGLRLRSPK
ncbi:MAG TPA: site-specific integrase, partial [Kineosporiaceae bacterium]|nr:site-specific integrase [Kineosporiaceae bacterium]